MINKIAFMTSLAAIILSGCAQTNQIDPVTTSSIDPVAAGSTTQSGTTTANTQSPSPLIASSGERLGSKVTPLGEGKARIIVTTLNSVNIRDKHACELGRFAQSRNATSVLTPLQTQVKTDIEGAQTYRIVDQEFSYYVEGEAIPSGTTSTATLLKSCRA